MCTKSYEKTSNYIRVSKIPIVLQWNHIMEPSIIRTTWSLKFLGGMPLVKGLTTINTMLMCSKTTLFSLTHSLMAKYLMSMCLLRLSLLLFLAMNIATKLFQYNFNGLEIESTTLSSYMKLFNHTHTIHKFMILVL